MCRNTRVPVAVPEAEEEEDEAALEDPEMEEEDGASITGVEEEDGIALDPEEELVLLLADLELAGGGACQRLLGEAPPPGGRSRAALAGDLEPLLVLI